MTAGVLLFTNNAGSTLAGAITNTATLLNVATGGGALFPSPGAGQYFKLTVIDAATGLLTEFMHVTNVTGDQFTVVRAQEGSTALAWSAGDLVELTTTAGTLAAMAQQAQLQSNSTNYSTDSGAANALVGALSPVPVSLASLTGAPISIKVAASNTGAATLNLNSLGVTGIVNGDGSALSGGQLLAGQIIEVAYNGAYFQLLGPKTPSATVPLFSTVSIKSTNYTLTTGDSGALIDAGAVAITLIAAPFVGYATSIISNATGTTILPNGNTVNLASGATSSTISLPAAGDFVTLAWDGSVWRVVGGSATMLNAALHSQFTTTTTSTSGVMTRPDGTIIQWAYLVGPFGTSADTGFYVTFPNAFPNNCFFAIAIPANAASFAGYGQSMLEVVGFTQTRLNLFSDAIGGSGSSYGFGGIYLYAIGN